MKKILLLFLIIVMFSSCASFFNFDMQKISVSSDKNIKIVSIDSSIKAIGKNNSFFVLRSRKPIHLNLLVNDSEKTIDIKSRNSIEYWSNIYFNDGIGLLVEKDNPKRFCYPSQIYLEYKDSNIIIRRFPPIKKGTVNWHIGLPIVNFIQIKTIGGHRNSGGIFGIESGLDYFYKDNQYLSLYAGIAGDFSFPDKVNRYKGEFQSSVANFINARNNFYIGRLNFGYGLNVSEYEWKRTTFDTSYYFRETWKNICVGFSFMAAYRFSNESQFSVLYQPNFLNFSSKPTLDYFHFISMEFCFKIHCRKVSLQQ